MLTNVDTNFPGKIILSYPDRKREKEKEKKKEKEKSSRKLRERKADGDALGRRRRSGGALEFREQGRFLFVSQWRLEVLETGLADFDFLVLSQGNSE